MSFNDWISSSSSSSMSRQPLSTTTNFNDIKQQHHHYHYHYHYHYAPMGTTISQSLYPHYQHQKQEQSNSFALVPSMPMINDQLPLKYKENLYRNPAHKLRRCVALFLHLIGRNFHKNKNSSIKYFFIDNSSISDFLQHDKYFQHADKVQTTLN